MKNYSKKALIALSVLSVFCASQAAHADGTPDLSIVCEKAYKDKIDGIKHYNKWEYGFSIAPAGVGLTLIYLGAQGGSPPLVEGGAALALAGGAVYGVIYIPKYFRSKGLVEVDDNMNEASGKKPGDKALGNTENIIRKKTHNDALTEDEVRAAIQAAAKDGAFCQEGGKLVTKNEFRDVVIKYLNAKPEQAAQIAIAAPSEISGKAQLSDAAMQENLPIGQAKALETLAPAATQTTAAASTSGSPN
jgi:hypothetical protein